MNTGNTVMESNDLAELLAYFRTPRPSPLKPIPHPDRAVNELLAAHDGTLRPAAVLIPITRHTDDNQVILTVRSENLRSHAGQISFPGGSYEEQDADLIATALRETHEEVGITAAQVEVLGILGDMALPSGFIITPVVGLVDNDIQLTPCPEEVADIFHVPLKVLLDPERYRSSEFSYENKPRMTLELHYEDYRIWGATAAILFHLATELSTDEYLHP